MLLSDPSRWAATPGAAPGRAVRRGLLQRLLRERRRLPPPVLPDGRPYRHRAHGRGPRPVRPGDSAQGRHRGRGVRDGVPDLGGVVELPSSSAGRPCGVRARSRRAGRKSAYWAYPGSRPVRREHVPGVAGQTGARRHPLAPGVAARCSRLPLRPAHRPAPPRTAPTGESSWKGQGVSPAQSKRAASSRRGSYTARPPAPNRPSPVASATPVPASSPRPAGDVEQQAVQRPADQLGVAPARPRARVVVVGAVDPAAQQLFVITVHPFSVAAPTDSRARPPRPPRSLCLCPCSSWPCTSTWCWAGVAARSRGGSGTRRTWAVCPGRRGRRRVGAGPAM
ncbi:hypothetical protein SGLAM104S_04449 [Streptomyces glaucescens]